MTISRRSFIAGLGSTAVLGAALSIAPSAAQAMTAEEREAERLARQARREQQRAQREAERARRAAEQEARRREREAQRQREESKRQTKRIIDQFWKYL